MKNNESLYTLIIGASENENRYSNMAVRRLVEKGIPVCAVGKKEGHINNVPVIKEIPTDKQFHTVSVYLNPHNQVAIMEKIISLKPARIIFNPGTENPAFIQKAKEAGIQPVIACTLVMLTTGDY